MSDSRKTLMGRWCHAGGAAHADESTEALAVASNDEAEVLHARIDTLTEEHSNFAELTTEILTEVRKVIEEMRAENERLEARIETLEAKRKLH